MAVFKHEYVSAVVDMGPVTSGNVWELDIRVANRGETTEPFHVQFLGKLPDVQVIWIPEFFVGPAFAIFERPPVELPPIVDPGPAG